MALRQSRTSVSRARFERRRLQRRCAPSPGLLRAYLSGVHSQSVRQIRQIMTTRASADERSRQDRARRAGKMQCGGHGRKRAWRDSAVAGCLPDHLSRRSGYPGPGSGARISWRGVVPACAGRRRLRASPASHPRRVRGRWCPGHEVLCTAAPQCRFLMAAEPLRSVCRSPSRSWIAVLLPTSSVRFPTGRTDRSASTMCLSPDGARQPSASGENMPQPVRLQSFGRHRPRALPVAGM